MTTAWPVVRLDEVAEVRLGRQRSPKNHQGHEMRPYVRAANVGWRGLRLDDVKWMNFTDAEMAVYGLQPGDLLLNEASGSAREVGKPAIWSGEIDGCAFQNTLIRVRPIGADSRYLLHYFAEQASSGAFARKSRGVGIHHLGREALAAWPIPLPPIEEQRRIAAVLDQADELRAKRRTSLALLDSLLGATFREMFAGAWPSVPLAELLTAPLRNGVSPATSGTVSSRVLTLSAVTGATFEERAVKEAKFVADPPSGKRVCSKDLLICRGNGNLTLVGKGYFPGRDMPDVAFPDTVIAARVSAERMDPAFLEHLWGTLQVRRQIESMARTTNGTFKVNQAMLESVEVPDPPLHLQRHFGRTVRSLRSLRQRLKASATSQDALFASLQHRAFAEQL